MARTSVLVLVRDDFWMAATRFMSELEIRLVEGENSSAVDLFLPRHARKVLMAFGRAYGTLPDRSGELDRNQQSFLDQAISGLAQDGKIIPVRLALLAEMMKAKAWTPSTLKRMGGAEGDDRVPQPQCSLVARRVGWIPDCQDLQVMLPIAS
ncbi:MAG: hypothetical protein ACP5XB_11680 [Isosphaeraceae bacterium]